jgi:hypothetical protein
MWRRKLDSNSNAAMKVWDSLEAEVFMELKCSHSDTYKKVKKMRKTLKPQSSKIFFDNFPNMISSKIVVYIVRKRQSSKVNKK